MMLCRVVGTVVGDTRSDKISGARFLLTSPCDEKGEVKGEPMVSLDLMGAGRDEVVLVSQGSSVRQTEITRDKPVDAVIIGIVDQIETAGDYTYRKDNP